MVYLADTLIEKESSHITYTTPYISAKEPYSKSKYLVMIGYSFGKNESGLDDIHTFEHIFKEMYVKNPIPILIISPDHNYELLNQIQDTVKSNGVYTLNMYWDCLSKAIVDFNISGNQHKKTDTYCILDRYYFYEDCK